MEMFDESIGVCRDCSWYEQDEDYVWRCHNPGAEYMLPMGREDGCTLCDNLGSDHE